jgi:formylglycine-generating enzyme required for sulfatase activity
MIPFENNAPPSLYDDDKPVVNHAIFEDGFPVPIVAEFTKKLGKKTGGHYRMPTEAEWEYAARAGTTTKYFFGDSAGENNKELKKYAWFIGNSDEELHKVALKEPNPWGLYDMYGNAQEFVQDYYHKDYYKQRIKDDPVNRDQVYDDVSSYRVLRGGNYRRICSVVCTAEELSSTARQYTLVSAFHSYGFRLVRER